MCIRDRGQTRTPRPLPCRWLGSGHRRRHDAPRRAHLEEAMIVDLPSTTTAAVSRKLVKRRNDVGSVALGRVLTLIIVADEPQATNEAIEAANDASRQHPCRIIALLSGKKVGASRLDAQIRVGGDAGASEVIVLRTHGT